MKKSTLLLCLLALCSGTLLAETVQVTTAEMNAATEGSLLQVMAAISGETETTVEFNFDGETLEYNTEDCKGIDLDKKNVKIDGLNKKNGKPVTIVGGSNYFLNLSGGSNVSMENLVVKGFSAIAIKMSGDCSFSATKCVFRDNRDPKNESGNNGGVARINNCNATFDQCWFYNNKGMGSYGGGALCFYTAESTMAPALRITNCTFEYNEAVSGGAVGVNVLKKGVVPSVYIANSTFANNTCGNRGGALYMQTAETTGSFEPVVVNCTFVGNLNNITNSDDGGAINVWARATAEPMKPVLINNLFAENYYDPWYTNPLNDVKAFYLEGDKAGDEAQPQTVFPVCKNNYFAAANDKFYQVLDAADDNALIDFSSDAVFAATEQNPWDENDPEYSHMTATLMGDLHVAMIAKNSVVIGKGLKSYEGIEIPTTDQLGNPRPEAPAVGAVEYAAEISGIESAVVGNELRIWNDGRVVYAAGLDGEAEARVYNLTGSLVYEGVIADGAALELPVAQGIYLIVVDHLTQKLIVR